MIPGTGALEASQVVAGQLAKTCGDLTQNPSECGVPPSMGNPSAGSVYTIGNLTTCDGKSPYFVGAGPCRNCRSATCENPTKNHHTEPPNRRRDLRKTNPKMEIAMTNSTPGHHAPIAPSALTWLAQTHAWFNKHPEREFLVAELSPSNLGEAIVALWVVGSASQPKPHAGGIPHVKINTHRPTIPAIVRRADPAEGLTHPGVFVLDDGMTLPPWPMHPQLRARDQDKFGAFVWQASVEAGRKGVSLMKVLSATGIIKRG